VGIDSARIIKIGETPTNEMVARRVNHRGGVTDAVEAMDGARGQCLHQVLQMECLVPEQKFPEENGYIIHIKEITNNENR